MITFKREGSVLKMILDYFVPYGCSWNSTFTNEFTNEHHAQLTFWRIKEEFDNKVRSIRREEYERGWKDAKGHKTKSDWFSSAL